jgi:amino acid adenylation domain-containing protein/non-ribosomal peptide synthase protein (TIGR01720 family)
MVIGVLGILKAGGAYLPIDPTYPQDRIAYMLDDSAVEVVITQRHLAQGLPLGERQRILLDAEPHAQAGSFLAFAGDDIDRRSVGLSPRHLAYAIYTSGSTGQPKGVLIEHRGWVNLAHSQGEFFAIDQDSRVLQFASLSFDAAASEIAIALTRGAALHLVPESVTKSPDGLAEVISRDGITHATLPPALLPNLDRSRLASVTGLIVAGEAISREEADRWADGRHLYNAYGPTETTVCATAARVQPGRLHVGRPLPNVRCLILNRTGQLAPIGVPGELCVGGIQVARGYLGRPALNAERFIADPFGGDCAEGKDRLYRTGDLARWLPDGNIEILGRIDSQVKVRGFRIEPGEIEARLLRHAQVDACTVLAREDKPGDRRLVAYVVQPANAAGDDEEGLQHSLREHLRRALPDYMMPSAFVFLQSLPLTANGKVDRRALPAPDTARRAVVPGVAPRTPAEHILVDVWQRVLRVSPVGVTDNFFSLGGDSILAIQVISQANARGLSLSPKHLFEHQTIRALASQQAAAGTDAPEEFVSGELLPLPIQRAFLDSDPSHVHHFHQSVMVGVPEGFTPGFLQAFVEALHARHDVLRLRFHETNGQWRAGYRAWSPAWLSECVQTQSIAGQSKQEIQSTFALRGQALKASFDIERGPLIKAMHFQADVPADSRLLFVAHHLVVDGVSWRILLDDLLTAFGQWRHSLPIALPAKTHSYGQWARALQRHARSDAMKAEQAYWVRCLSRHVPRLPTDHSDVADESFRTEAVVTMTLDVDTTSALLGRCADAYRTRINDLLLAALLLAMHRWTRQDAVRVDMEGHGREDLFDGIDTTGTIGWFTTVFPLTLALPDGFGARRGDEQYGALIKAVKEQLRSVPHHGIGYGLLRHMVQDPDITDLERAHPAEVVFNYLGQFDRDPSTDPLFAVTGEFTGHDVDGGRRRSHALAFNGYLSQGALTFNIDFNQHAHRRETMEDLARGYQAALEELVAHCQGRSTASYTPSDFALAGVAQADLDQWHARYPRLVDLYPATGLQAGLLFHSLLDEQGDAYVTQTSMTLRGVFDVGAFRRAWRLVVERHAIFRTAFVGFERDRLLQLVVDDATFEWHEEDWRDVAPDEQKARFLAYRQRDKARGFDPEVPTLMRFATFKLSEQCEHFLWTHHHALMDGWSLPIVTREVLGAYAAYCEGGTPDLPRTDAYHAYIAWLEAQDRDAARQFWREELAGVSGRTELGIEQRSPLLGRAGTGFDVRRLSRDQTSRLEAAVRRCQVTLSTAVQAAWACLLSRHAGRRQVVFGATVSGRHAQMAGIDGMVGLFINTLPVCVDVDDDLDVATWLRSLQSRYVEREGFSHLPLNEILHCAPGQAASGLFDSLVVFENYPIETAGQVTPGAAAPSQHPRGLAIEDIHADERTNYGLSLTVLPGDELTLKLQYAMERFDERAISGLLRQLQHLLDAMAAPDVGTVGSLAWCSEAERAEILVGRNETASHYPSHLCLHDLFEAQARRRPDAIAVVAGASTLTYAELDRRADQLARRLIDLGVQPDTLVGICMERSCDMLVGLMGIAKSGAAYVPIDPSYPRARIEHMLVDSGVRIVVCDADLVHGLPLTTQHVLHVPGEGDHDLAADPRTRRRPGLTADHLAYVIYTSGSTGKPKGIAVPHRGLANFLHAMARQPGFTPEDRLLAVTTISFDIAALELYLPLVCGGRVILLPREDSVDGNVLADRLATHRPSVMQATPATWRMLLDAGWRPAPGMKLLCGGEAMPPPLKDALLANGARLYNMFGPTETTIWSTLAAMHEDDAVCIGHPIDNTQVYVLDSKMRPVPDGAMGELYIGGDGVARGYWNRPELTAERFVPDPFASQPGRHLYRTGDLARWRGDRSLEHLGRHDHQVKIRGHRIELGEIEAVLASHADVADVAVTVHEDERSAARLLACLVMRDGRPLLQGALREFIERQLPPFMVPSVWIGLPVIPRTPNGKVDRAALPSPDRSEASAATGSVAPRNALELQVATIWEQVLGVSGVGIRDGFFEQGGQSLLAVQLMARIKDRFACRIPLASFLQSPTVEQLALLVKQSSSTACAVESPLVPLQPEGDGRPLFLVPGAGGNVIYFRDLALLVGPGLPVHGLQAKGLDGKSAPLDDVQAMAAHYLRAVRTFQPQGPYRLGGHSFGAFVALEMARQLHAGGERVERLVVLDQPVPTREPHAAPDAADLAGTLVDIAVGLGHSFGKRLSLSRESLEGLDRDAQLAALHRCLLEAEILPAGFDMADIRGYVDVWQAGMLAQRRYRLGQDAPRVPVTLCRAAEFAIPAWASGELAETFADPAWGWQRVSDGPVDVHEIPGAHITMLNRPHVDSLARVLTRMLPHHARGDSILASASPMQQRTIN